MRSGSKRLARLADVVVRSQRSRESAAGPAAGGADAAARSTSSSASSTSSAKGKLLRRLLAADRLGSVIFYGPPGTGKTTLARLLASASRSHFRQLSAVASGVKELREVLDEARDRLSAAGQRDAAVRRRNPPLQQGPAGRAAARRGRGRGDPGRRDDARTRSSRSTARWSAAAGSSSSSRSRSTTSRRCSAGRWPTSERGLGQYASPPARRRPGVPGRGERRRRPPGAVGPGGRRAVERRVGRSSSPGSWPRSRCSARRCSTTGRATPITTPISALIKSIRGSDPDAALYWLARMLEGGEDVRFLARRLVILASEDVGNADPAGAAAGRGRGAGLRVGRPARVPADAGPGGDLSGLCAEVERGDGGLGEARATCAKAGCCPCPVSARLPLRRPSGSATARATNTPTTSPTPSPRRIIWASSASIIARPIAASSGSWPSGWRRFGAAARGQTGYVRGALSDAGGQVNWARTHES